MGVVLRAACSGLHPCPLKFDRSVLERCCSQFAVLWCSTVASRSYRSRVSSDRRSERLEPYEGKLSRTVLRGLGGSNPARPLDPLLVYGLARNRRSPKRPPEPRPSGVHPEEGEVEKKRA